jgi:hypothetical protein
MNVTSLNHFFFSCINMLKKKREKQCWAYLLNEAWKVAGANPSKLNQFYILPLSAIELIHRPIFRPEVVLLKLETRNANGLKAWADGLESCKL